MNYYGLQGFTIDCRCTHFFYIVITKCAQNLKFLVDKKPNNLVKASGGQPSRHPALEIHYWIKPFSYIYLPIPIIVKKIARLDTGITDKFEPEKSSTLKSVQNEFTKGYISSCRGLISKPCPGPQKSSQWQPWL